MVTKDTVNMNNNNDHSGGTNTGLIAGLTTGLVVAAVVTLTAGLLIYRKRKRAQMNIKTKPGSVETPPTFTDTPPMAPSATPPLSSITVTTPITAIHPGKEPLFIGSPLFIPPLAATRLDQPKETTIQRSLTLSSKLARIPVTNNTINRSSSVKMTKYDYNPPILDDDDLDHVQIRRAISVKRRNAAMAHRTSATPLTLVSRSTSLRSQITQSRLLEDGSTLPTIEPIEDDSDDESTTAGSGAIQVICAKPTIARIRSISRKDSSKKPTSSDNNPPLQHERLSTPNSTNSSTLADGEITVYWQPPSN